MNNKPTLITLLALSLHLAPPALHAQSEPAYLNPDLPVDTRVNDLLARMTLEEKTSQMTHTTRGIPRSHPQRRTIL